MKKSLFLAALLSTVASATLAQELVTTITDPGFALPESFRYDAENDRYLVSNIGEVDAADGFISVISPDGEVTELKWIDGAADGVDLVDPKGMQVRDGKLYVADVGVVRVFDLASGAPSATLEVPDAISLNDLVIAEDGTVYVTDRGTRESPFGAIFAINPAGEVRTLVSGNQLNNPNGITLTPEGQIVYVTVGEGAADVTWRNANGGLLRSVTLPTGGLDGVLFTDDGRLIVSSLAGGAVYAISPAPERAVSTLISGVESPAALGYDAERNRLLVPQLMAGQVQIYQLDTAEAAVADAGPEAGAAGDVAGVDPAIAGLPDGEPLYVNNCGACHGEAGQGGAGPRLVGSRSVNNIQGMLTQIFYGSNLMPSFDFLSNEEIAAITNYVRTGLNSQTDLIGPDDVATFR